MSISVARRSGGIHLGSAPTVTARRSFVSIVTTLLMILIYLPRCPNYEGKDSVVIVPRSLATAMFLRS